MIAGPRLQERRDRDASLDSQVHEPPTQLAGRPVEPHRRPAARARLHCQGCAGFHRPEPANRAPTQTSRAPSDAVAIHRRPSSITPIPGPAGSSHAAVTDDAPSTSPSVVSSPAVEGRGRDRWARRRPGAGRSRRPGRPRRMSRPSRAYPWPSPGRRCAQPRQARRLARASRRRRRPPPPRRAPGPTAASVTLSSAAMGIGTRRRRRARAATPAAAGMGCSTYSRSERPSAPRSDTAAASSRAPLRSSRSDTDGPTDSRTAATRRRMLPGRFRPSLELQAPVAAMHEAARLAAAASGAAMPTRPLTATAVAGARPGGAWGASRARQPRARRPRIGRSSRPERPRGP